MCGGVAMNSATANRNYWLSRAIDYTFDANMRQLCHMLAAYWVNREILATTASSHQWSRTAHQLKSQKQAIKQRLKEIRNGN